MVMGGFGAVTADSIASQITAAEGLGMGVVVRELWEP